MKSLLISAFTLCFSMSALAESTLPKDPDGQCIEITRQFETAYKEVMEDGKIQKLGTKTLPPGSDGNRTFLTNYILYRMEMGSKAIIVDHDYKYPVRDSSARPYERWLKVQPLAPDKKGNIHSQGWILVDGSFKVLGPCKARISFETLNASDQINE